MSDPSSQSNTLIHNEVASGSGSDHAQKVDLITGLSSEFISRSSKRQLARGSMPQKKQPIRLATMAREKIRNANVIPTAKMATQMSQEPNMPSSNQENYTELEQALSVPGGVDLHQIIDSVRASSFVMKEIARKNQEIKNNADNTIAILQTDLLSEKQKALEFQEKFNELTKKMNEIAISAFEQRNAFIAQLDELTAVNANLSDRNLFLEQELQKAHDWLELIYSTAATELKLTLDELEKTNQVDLQANLAHDYQK